MRIIPWIAPFLLAAAVVAQQADSAEDLVAKLGHEDYAVREQATKSLIELGEKAVPALEQALKSDDIEVRLRAGRALRAIRNAARKPEREPLDKGEQAQPGPGPGHATSSSVRIEMRDGKVRVTVGEIRDGQTVEERTYEGDSLEELKKQHPELRKHLGSMRFEFGRQPAGPGKRDPFDMDRFWEDWDKDFNDDFMKRWREDVDRWQRWMQRWDEQRRRTLRDLVRPRPAPAADVLGIRASRPPAVLDAQLELRGRGLVVDAVEKGTRADALGLRRFDILIKLQDTEIRDARDVARILEQVKEDAPLRATVLRRGQVTELRTGQ